MFSSSDLLDIAIQIERNGEKSYREASRHARDSEIAEVLRWMADEEARHVKWFERQSPQQPKTQEEQEMEAMGRALLQEMVSGQTFSLEQQQLNRTADLRDMVEQSLGFERDTIMFYEFLLGLIDEPGAAAQLEAIIEEERGHIKELEQLIEALV